MWEMTAFAVWSRGPYHQEEEGIEYQHTGDGRHHQIRLCCRIDKLTEHTERWTLSEIHAFEYR